MEGILQKIRKTMLEHDLVPAGCRVMAGVSGGADSVALLLALDALAPEMGFSLCAAHLNHGIRGEAADRDQAFTEALCLSRGIELYAERMDIPAIARAQGKTLEQAARDERYGFFRRGAQFLRADRIAVAHHMDDQAESIMLHLVRGTGLRGLCGMQYRRDNVIRPLLDVRREEIEQFLAGLNQPYCTDDTNFDRDASRNRLRLDVIPYIAEHLNGGFVEGLCSTGELLRRDEEYLDGIAKDALAAAKTDAGYDRNALAALPWPIQTRAIRLALREAGAATDIDRVHVERVQQLLTMRTGAQAHLPHADAWISYGSLCLGERGQLKRVNVPFSFEGKTEFPGGYYFAEIVEGDIIKDNTVAYMDADSLPKDLTVRTRTDGDRFFPLGAPGSKKLKDVFIDRKVPRDQRDVPILFCGSEALFVPGCGVSQRVRVDDATERILKVTFHRT